MSLLEKNTWRLATSLFSRLTSLLSFIFLQLFSSHCYYIHFVLLDFIWNYLVFSSPGWSLRKLRQITRGKQHFLFSSIKKNKQIVVWGFIIFFVLFVSVLVLFPPLIFLSKSLIIPPPPILYFSMKQSYYHYHYQIKSSCTNWTQTTSFLPPCFLLPSLSPMFWKEEFYLLISNSCIIWFDFHPFILSSYPIQDSWSKQSELIFDLDCRHRLFSHEIIAIALSIYCCSFVVLTFQIQFFISFFLQNKTREKKTREKRNLAR